MEEILENIGFTDKQAKVYLACLELGKDTVYNIALKCGLKRPTVYLVLADLAQKGYVAVAKTQKAIYYSSTHPKKLLTNLQHQEAELQTQLVNLESLYNSHNTKPKIRTYEGIKSVEQLYDEITDYARQKGKEVLAFGTVYFLQSVHQPQYHYWLKNIQSKRCHIREILNSDQPNADYLKKIKQLNNPNHRLRFIPYGQQLFQSDSMIYDNKVALFSSTKDYFVIVIESDNIVNSFKAFFALGWQTAQIKK